MSIEAVENVNSLQTRICACKKSKKTEKRDKQKIEKKI